ncbi:MAG TPA: RluA family pseudouridine synthase [Pirellulaceae bacterium]|nr:RluA family pseudouridine synthase [Pirellulaceae bacterium]
MVALEEAGQRLDAFLALKFPLYSRVHLRRVISANGVRVNDNGPKPSYKMREGDRVVITLPDLPRSSPIPEKIPLDVLYEDDDMVAINKAPYMVVHPSRGHWSGTLTSALAFHFETLSSMGGANRPGIVHRLDRDTSGVIVVAKNDRAHAGLTEQFEARTTEKEYFAICIGNIDRDRDRIVQPIGPHVYQREKMAVRVGHPLSRDADTFYEVLERFDGFTAVKAMPKTGRTHQIRVHLTFVGSPILCDKLYGSRAQITRGEIRNRREDADVVLHRQALHAHRLRIAHPISGAPLEFVAPLPRDLQAVMDELRAHRPWRAK